jgi:hypothetical protein
VTEKTDNSIQDITAKALQLTAATGLEAGCQLIEAEGVSIDAALAYKEFAQELYRQNKNVQHMIDAGQRGIEFALDHAARAKSDDAETAAALMKMARIISYNVGANTWPGWGDDGISISPDQRAAGIDAAALSLRLANELRLGPQQMGNLIGWWQRITSWRNASRPLFPCSMRQNEHSRQRTTPPPK